MSADLIRQLKKSRELTVTVGKFTFTVRRPTDVEALDLQTRGMGTVEIARDFVTGWEAVTEDDIVGGGGQTAVPFSQALWAEWCADRPDFWAPIGNAALEAWTEHANRMKAVEGN